MLTLSRRMVSAGGWAVLFWVAAPGCSDTSPRGSDPRGQAPAPNPKGPVAPEDHSLPAADYTRLGLPDHGRPWSGDDMAQAAKVLSAIAQQDPRQLPRYRSERSGAILARLTAPENLECYRDRSAPIDVRLPRALAYLESANVIYKLYVAASLRRAASGSELAETLGGALRTTVIAFELVEEFLPTLPKDDPKHAARMAGLEQMKQGFGLLVTAGLLALTEKDVYSAAERVRLIGYMKETVPMIVRRLSRAARTETLARLRGLATDAAFQDLQPSLDALHTEVRKSIEAADGP